MFGLEAFLKLKLENEKLQKENKQLKEQLAYYESLTIKTSENPLKPIAKEADDLYLGIQPTVHIKSPVQEKITLFRSLFQGRQDVYAKRWEGKNGKSGYTPVCENEWIPQICLKPSQKCSDCSHRKLSPLIDKVIYEHLNKNSTTTIGIYPLLHDETCLFITIDFDKKGWQEDSLSFTKVCREQGIPSVLERSRSGNGAHVWIFFDEPIPASLARNMGCALLTYTMEKRHHLGLESYDRLFPNQDTMPIGGFGNLIALPLQGSSRSQGNSVFVDDHFNPYKDQWAFLSSIKKMSISEVDRFVDKAARQGKVVGIQVISTDEEEKPWTNLFLKEGKPQGLTGPFPEKITIVHSNLLYIKKDNLSSNILNHLKRLAAFHNPEFYHAQAMRMNTYGKPRIIGCAEDYAHYLGLPRGCLYDVLKLMKDHNIKVNIMDERYPGIPTNFKFHGELRANQKEAVESLLKYDKGVLSASTAFGKTVVASWMLAARGVNTLILVHRKQLMEQWKERLATYLNLPVKEIGQIGGGKNKQTGKVDIAVMQSLNRRGEVKEFVADYGHVIIDECHHLSAFSFEQILKKVKAKYVLGLTATPIRKDGHHPIITMQCGPIRYRVDAKKQAIEQPFEYVVVPRFTGFRLEKEVDQKVSIQGIYESLIKNEQRNDLIFHDVMFALKQGRTPLLLTERTAHVDYFANRLAPFVKNLIVLHGGMGKKQRNHVMNQLKEIPEQEERLIIATGRYIGEGFDDPRLDTMFLALPISWKGTLQQYAGRLHRFHYNKKLVKIFDYVDQQVPMLHRMYEKRKKGYENMGYQLDEKIWIQEQLDI